MTFQGQPVLLAVTSQSESVKGRPSSIVVERESPGVARFKESVTLFDPAGSVTERSTFQRDGSLELREVFLREEGGRLLQVLAFGDTGSPIWTKHFVYSGDRYTETTMDDSGHPVETVEVVCDSDGRVLRARSSRVGGPEGIRVNVDYGEEGDLSGELYLPGLVDAIRFFESGGVAAIGYRGFECGTSTGNEVVESVDAAGNWIVKRVLRPGTSGEAAQIDSDEILYRSISYFPT
jgi:hypothetical protein